MRASLGELPAALRKRLEQTYGITPYDADVLVNQGRPLVDYYVELAEACGDGKAASNWIQQDVLRWLGEQQVSIAKYPVAAKSLAELIKRSAAAPSRPAAAARCSASWSPSANRWPTPIAALGIATVDDSALVELCRKLVAANPEDRRRSPRGQAQGPRRPDRPGEEGESQRQCHPRARDLPGIDRDEVSSGFG